MRRLCFLGREGSGGRGGTSGTGTDHGRRRFLRKRQDYGCPFFRQCHVDRSGGVEGLYFSSKGDMAVRNRGCRGGGFFGMRSFGICGVQEGCRRETRILEADRGTGFLQVPETLRDFAEGCGGCRKRGFFGLCFSCSGRNETAKAGGGERF